MRVHLSITKPLIAIAGIGFAVSACSPIVEHRGFVADPEKMAAITPHVDTKETVMAALGTPSTVAPFDDSTWYYMSSTTKHYAFQNPKVIDRNVTEIQFDKDGTVADIEHYGLKDGKKVAMVERVTPTKGKKLSVLQQMFGNFGSMGNVAVPEGPNRPSHRPGQGPATGSAGY